MTSFTHVIRGRKAQRHLSHHHRGPALNKRHAVNDPALQIRHYATAETVCGATVTVQELDEYAGGPVYNCWPATADSRVTCKDCLKKLAR